MIGGTLMREFGGGATNDAISAVAVVVPVNDEEALLARCLDALAIATGELRRVRPHCRVEVIAVLDACLDGSAAVASRYDVHVTTIDRRCVGAARAAGATHAASLLGLGVQQDADQAWLACTDADSAVPPDWLTQQVEAAAGGADLTLGRVRPDPQDLDDSVRRAWWREHVSSDPTSHIHGANLGVRWSAFATAGGFESVPEHEDVLLVDRLLSRGVRVVRAREVLTSGRRHGRAPGGFSGYLRDLDATLDGTADGA